MLKIVIISLDNNLKKKLKNLQDNIQFFKNCFGKQFKFYLFSRRVFSFNLSNSIYSMTGFFKNKKPLKYESAQFQWQPLNPFKLGQSFIRNTKVI